MPTTALPQRLHVCLDTTPGARRTDSDIFWWLPVIGPTATVLAHALARHTSRTGTTWEAESLAQQIGLAGNRSKLRVSLDRLDRFALIRFRATDVVTIRLWLPQLTARQLDRLPSAMAETYCADHTHVASVEAAR